VKIAYPKYQIFKSRLKIYLFKDVKLEHKPIESSIQRVRNQMQELGLLCPMVLDPHIDRVRSGTNRYLELKRQGYDGSLFYKSKTSNEAELFHHLNVIIFKKHPISDFNFIYNEEDLKKFMINTPDLLKENGFKPLD
jgi:hypothetical protein